MGFIDFFSGVFSAIFNGFKRIFSSPKPIHSSSLNFSDKHRIHRSFYYNRRPIHSSSLNYSDKHRIHNRRRVILIQKDTEFLQMGHLEEFPMPFSILTMERNVNHSLDGNELLK